MTITTLIIILLVFLLIGANPGWGYFNNYGPSGIVGVLLVILVVLVLLGRI